MEVVSLSVLVLASFLAAASVPMLTLLIFRHVEAGLCLLALPLVLKMSLGESPSFTLGINMYPEDIVYFLLTVVAGLRLAFVQPGVRISWIWLAFGVVLFVLFGLGAASFGTRAGVDFRTYFYAWGASFYAMTFRFDAGTFRRTLSGIVWLGVWAELAACLQWSAPFTGISLLAADVDSTNAGTLRVINSGEALLLANAVILTLYFSQIGGAVRYMRSLNLLWIPSVLLLQHRSVWLAAMGGIVIAIVLQRRNRFLFNPAQIVLGAIAATVFVAVMLSGRGMEPVASAVGESARRGVMMEDTAAWRLSGWQQLLKKWSSGGPAVLAIGFPFGSEKTRYDKFGRTTVASGVQAHNAYVQTLYNGGVVGLGLFLAFVAHLAWSLKKLSHAESCRNSCYALLALLACQLVYYIAYGIEPLQVFLLGVAYGYVASNQPDPQLSPAAGTQLAQTAR